MPDTIGEAFVAIRPDTQGFGKETQSQVSGVLKGLATGFAAIKVGDFFSDALGEARDSQKVGAQTTAVIKSTGEAAGVTAGQVEDLAGALSKKAGIDDEVIQSGENMLLTFTNIRNEAGKGNDIFDRAATATLDMAVAMKSATGGEVDLKGASIQLGKALNDPIKGVTALTRVGVTFNDQQKAQIAALQESGDTLGAQKVILAEVTKEFGGSAAAQATSADKASVAWGNLKEAIGTALIPVIDKLLTLAQPVIDFLAKHQELATTLAFVIGTTLVAAFVAWGASAAAAAFTTLIAMAPVLLAIATIGLAIADVILIWQRFGPAIQGAINDTIIPAINLFIDGINTIIDGLNAIPLLGFSISHVGHVGELGDSGQTFNRSGGVGNQPYGPPLAPGQQYSVPIGPGLNGYADGGMVGGPIGAAQLAIVHGGERVLTPEQQRAAGGDHVHLHYERMPRNGVQVAVEAFHGLRAARQAAAL